MKLQVLVGTDWRDAEGTIVKGHAVVKLPFPYEPAVFKQWRHRENTGQRAVLKHGEVKPIKVKPSGKRLGG